MFTGKRNIAKHYYNELGLVYKQNVVQGVVVNVKRKTGAKGRRLEGKLISYRIKMGEKLIKVT